MSTSSLAGRIRANRKSRSPVQDTVSAKYDEISAARAEGCSIRDLHAQLTREGHNVGAGPSSLFAALKAEKARRAGRLSEAPANRAANTTSSITPSAGLPSVVVDDRRKTTDWG